jgi:hypothetical protein
LKSAADSDDLSLFLKSPIPVLYYNALLLEQTGKSLKYIFKYIISKEQLKKNKFSNFMSKVTLDYIFKISSSF